MNEGPPNSSYFSNPGYHTLAQCSSPTHVNNLPYGKVGPLFTTVLLLHTKQLFFHILTQSVQCTHTSEHTLRGSFSHGNRGGVRSLGALLRCTSVMTCWFLESNQQLSERMASLVTTRLLLSVRTEEDLFNVSLCCKANGHNSVYKL